MIQDHRRCKKCGESMDEGFCFGDGEFYYCSEECLYQDYTEQEYLEMHEGGYGYWTEWEE